MVYVYRQPTIMCEKVNIVFFAQNYSDDTYTSPDIDVMQISMGEAGRKGFVFQGHNNINNSMLTLSWYRHFFCFLTNEATSSSGKRLREATLGKQQPMDLSALVLARFYLCRGCVSLWRLPRAVNHNRTIMEVALTLKETKPITCSIRTHSTTAHQNQVSGTYTITLYRSNTFNVNKLNTLHSAIL